MLLSDTNFYVNFILFAFCAGTMALVLYWGATIENDIENNPDEKK